MTVKDYPERLFVKRDSDMGFPRVTATEQAQSNLLDDVEYVRADIVDKLVAEFASLITDGVCKGPNNCDMSLPDFIKAQLADQIVATLRNRGAYK